MKFVQYIHVWYTLVHAQATALLSTILLLCYIILVVGYHHNSCTNDLAKQYQFADCYLPNLAQDLKLKDASFLMSHDSATGYLRKNQKNLLTNGATNLYAKNQIGDVYQQLDDGARALDIRPKLLSNGTVILHHGAVPISVTLETLVTDAIRWSNDNPDELVLILHSDLAYSSSSSTSSGQNNNNNNGNNDDNIDDDNGYDDGDVIVPSADAAVMALSQVYANAGVTYVECSDLYELTVGEAMELADLSSYSSGNDNEQNGKSGGGGYLLAMDRHDAYAGSCAKQNYVADSLVTCYSNKDDVLPCTDRKSIQHRKLKEYSLASANNEPTDSDNVLGPPSSTYYHPFYEIQTLWQVDGVSAALGISHVSSIIDDNTKSHLNARIVDWIYEDSFDAVSLLVVDQVQLNGHALSSVLRNRCGQSELSYEYYYNNDENNDDNNYMYDYDIPCGSAVPKPHLREGKPLSTLSFFVTAFVCVVFGLWIAIFLAHYRKHHDHREEVKRIERDFQVAVYKCGCITTVDVDVDVDSNTIKSKTIGTNKEDPLLLPVID
mmetsp:Transcript_1891/g.2173  ORF Transcript_1891/g.2173 Transcript_1891/m.2173 type:complete len:549 (-) Transcript_1891:159-1805(-)